MNRSIKIAGAQTGKNHFEGGYKILAQKTKSRADYEAAIRHFDKVCTVTPLLVCDPSLFRARADIGMSLCSTRGQPGSMDHQNLVAHTQRSSMAA
jgi:hypothetical protein